MGYYGDYQMLLNKHFLLKQEYKIKKRPQNRLKIKIFVPTVDFCPTLLYCPQGLEVGLLQFFIPCPDSDFPQISSIPHLTLTTLQPSPHPTGLGHAGLGSIRLQLCYA